LSAKHFVPLSGGAAANPGDGQAGGHELWGEALPWWEWGAQASELLLQAMN